MEDSVPIGSFTYGVMLALLLFGRGMDLLSTWVATPNLALEANPIAKKLGWKWGVIVNLGMCGYFATWPLPAIVIATTSVLVAARNLQTAWLARALGELAYRSWISARFAQTRWGLYLFCVWGQALLTAAVGGALMFFCPLQLVPFAVGMGIVTYAAAVAFYTVLAAWRSRRTLAAMAYSEHL